MTKNLPGSDVFNTRKWIINSDNAIYRFYNTSKTDTRILWLGVVYNLNSLNAGKTAKTDSPEADNGVIKLGY